MPATSTSKVKELMIMHERPGTPWIKVGTYIFEMCFNNYLIIPDYLSRYLVVKELSTTTADTVITATKETVSIKRLYRKTESLHQINHQEMPQIRRRYYQSIIQRPSDTTRHSLSCTVLKSISQLLERKYTPINIPEKLFHC